MFLQKGVVFLVLLLSGCGVSGFVYNEYITFSPETQSDLFKRKTFQSKEWFFWKIFTDKPQQYAGETKELMVDNVAIEFEHNEGGVVGLFPLVPPPPYMPVFINDASPLCPVSSDLRMSIRFIDEVSTLGEDKEIQEYLKQPDMQKIYLIKDDTTIIVPRHFWSEGYSYQVCFPITLEESDNTVLIVGGLVTQQNQKILIEPQRLRYYDEYMLGMGYLGSLVRCEFDAKASEHD